jgi:hypothetical protein
MPPQLVIVMPAKAGHPVRRGLSIPQLNALEYWIIRFRG